MCAVLKGTSLQFTWLVYVLYCCAADIMAGSLVPSDSTQAMASLVSAYGDDEGDDDTIHDTSRMSAPAEDEAAVSPDTRTQQAAANFISDDEEPHHSPQHTDDKNNQQVTKSPVVDQRPAERTSK